MTTDPDILPAILVSDGYRIRNGQGDDMGSTSRPELTWLLVQLYNDHMGKLEEMRRVAGDVER